MRVKVTIHRNKTNTRIEKHTVMHTITALVNIVMLTKPYTKKFAIKTLKTKQKTKKQKCWSIDCNFRNLV